MNIMQFEEEFIKLAEVNGFNHHVLKDKETNEQPNIIFTIFQKGTTGCTSKTIYHYKDKQRELPKSIRPVEDIFKEMKDGHIKEYKLKEI